MNIFTKQYLMRLMEERWRLCGDKRRCQKGGVKEVFEEQFFWMINNKRTEYVFKNAIAEKIYLGKYSQKTAAYYTEVRAGASIVDCLVVNGTTTAYEIKSDYDDLTRLPEQLNDYLKVFEYVYVVVSSGMVDRVLKMLPEKVGLITLTSRYTLSVVKQACSNLDDLDKERMFELLRISEMKKELAEYVSCVPMLPNTKIRKFYKNIFMTLSVDDSCGVVVRALRERRIKCLANVEVKRFPRSLYSVIAQLELPKSKWDELNTLFSV